MSPGFFKMLPTNYLLTNHLIYIYKVKSANLVEGNPKAPFLHFTLDPYLIVPGAKQGGIKDHFL